MSSNKNNIIKLDQIKPLIGQNIESVTIKLTTQRKCNIYFACAVCGCNSNSWYLLNIYEFVIILT